MSAHESAFPVVAPMTMSMPLASEALGAATNDGRTGAVVAIDLGATSGRVVLGRVGPGIVEITDVHRFPNQPVRTNDGVHWNILELYRNVLLGLRKALELEPAVLSLGVDSWAIDYALIKGGHMVATPFHYRDTRCERGVAAVERVIDRVSLYAESGLQFLPFSTLYQLAVDREDGMLDAETRMLLIPDLIAYWLTGEVRAERTNASTTGLLNVGGGGWNDALLDKLDLPRTLLPPLIGPGDRVGFLIPAVAAEIGASTALEVVAVASHDTASAVAATPLAGPNAAYISSGTWSLIGLELQAPILTEESRAANFTNEMGVDGRVRYLRNVMGMWLLNECVNGWRRVGLDFEMSALLQDAARAQRWALFDVDDPSLLPTGDMPSRIGALLSRQALNEPTPAEVTRSICESLAVAYATVLEQAEHLSGTVVDTIHFVGGGSQNTLLCQLVADRCNRIVLAGPVEATATGNVLVQARAAGLLSSTLEQLRATVAATHPSVQYTPQP